MRKPPRILKSLCLIAFALSSMGMGWVPNQTPSDPTEQNQVVSSLADQTMEHLGFRQEEAARYHERLLENLSWGQSKGYFPTAFQINGSASAMALIGISYDVGVTVAPLPNRELVLILTRNRIVEAGPQAGASLRVGFNLLFNSDPLQSQSGEFLEVTADLGTAIALQANVAVGITRADRDLKEDLVSSLVVGDTHGAKDDLRKIFFSPRPFAIGLSAGLDAGIGVGIAGGVGQELELARAQGTVDDLPTMIDSLLQQVTGQKPPLQPARELP